MAKQEIAKPSQQQLALDVTTPKAKPIAPAQSSRIAGFVDAGTLKIRQQAIQRVASAGIFARPKSKSK